MIRGNNEAALGSEGKNVELRRLCGCSVCSNDKLREELVRQRVEVLAVELAVASGP
jgi:hypothetical protein